MVYLDYTSSFEDLLKKDGAITVHMRNIQLVAIEMYKIVNDIGPKIMKDLVEFKPVLRQDEDDKVIGDMFVKAKVKTEFMGKGLLGRYFVPVVWDQMLRNDLKSIETLDKLKTEVKQDRKLSDARRDTWAHTSLRATVAHSLRSTSSIGWYSRKKDIEFEFECRIPKI